VPEKPRKLEELFKKCNSRAEMRELYKELGVFLDKVGTARACASSFLSVFHHPVASLHMQPSMKLFVVCTGMLS
jgi:hypothetical protein